MKAIQGEIHSLRKRWLILFNVFYLVSILFIAVLGPFYSNYSTEEPVGFESNSFVYTNLNFTASQAYYLVTPTRLDWESVIKVDFNSTQPTYIMVTEESALSLYDQSAFANVSGGLIYHVTALGNYTVYAQGFSGMANATVTILASIISRSKPYAVWGQAMYYGGIVLLGVSIVVIALSYLREKKPAAKQPSKAGLPKTRAN